MIEKSNTTARLTSKYSIGAPKQPTIIGTGSTLKQRFVLQEEIGRGGMGVVYRALDLRKQEAADREPHVAIKLISSKIKRLDDSIIALQREAKKAQKLAHPNIATVYDFDRDGEHAFLSMELLSGDSLATYIKKLAGRALPPEEALPIIQGMANGLAYAHSQNIIHADFKPENVFITSNNDVKILDFGVARAMTTESLTSQQTAFDAGKWKAISLAYASPEMFQQSTADPRDDIYALGCVSYQLLTGEHPYKQIPANIAFEQDLEPIEISGPATTMQAILKKSVDLERNNRVSSVAEFLEGMQHKEVSKAKHYRWLFAVILCCTALIGYWQFSINNSTAMQEKFQDPWLAQPAAVDEETQEKIVILIELAELHSSVGRFISPPTSNAAESYYTALTLQPGNPKALAGANAIAKAVLQKAEDLQQQGNTERASELVKESLRVLKNNPKLLEFSKPN